MINIAIDAGDTGEEGEGIGNTSSRQWKAILYNSSSSSNRNNGRKQIKKRGFTDTLATPDTDTEAANGAAAANAAAAAAAAEGDGFAAGACLEKVDC